MTKTKQQTKTIKLSLEEVEDITHFYLMSYLNWSEKARNPEDTKKEIYKRLADVERKNYKKFGKIRDKLKEELK